MAIFTIFMKLGILILNAETETLLWIVDTDILVYLREVFYSKQVLHHPEELEHSHTC